MSLRRFINQLFTNGFGRRRQEKEQRYDKVEIRNIVDGTVIRGHDAVKAHFEKEEALYKAYGSSIFFQVYRINLQADTIEEFQSEMLAEIRVDGEFVSGDDTVVAVRDKVHPLIEEKVQIESEDRITLFFNRYPMQEDKLFYADHFMMLPAWVQVFLHSCEFREVAQRAAELKSAGRG